MAATKLALLAALLGMVLSCVAASTFGSDSVTTITLNEYYTTSLANGAQTVVFGPSPALNTVLTFGKGEVYDFRVTIDNKEAGRARGLNIQNSVNGFYDQESFTISFQSGDYAGSTISFSGEWSDKSAQNEVPVTGGTGVFAFASGSAFYVDTGSYYAVRVILKGVVESHGSI